MNRSYWITISLFFLSVNFFFTGEDHSDKKSAGQYISEYTIGRIGFIHNFVSDNQGVEDEVSIGVESYKDTFYKLCSSDGESIVKGGLLSRGLNIIGFPVDLIMGKNKGVFFLYVKTGGHISGRQIVLLPDNIEIIETSSEIEDSGTVRDGYKYEMTVSGEDNRFNDYASRIVMDSVTGNYPGLTQGVPLLPILFLFINKVLKTVKKKKKSPVSLYSETELYIQQKKDKGKYSLTKLRILTSDM